MNVLEKILEEIKEVEKKFVVGHEVLFALGATGMATEIEEIIRSHMDEVDDDWIPVEERVPEMNTRVLATVKHSSWISDFHSEWVPEKEKIHYPETYSTYEAYINENGIWVFTDEEGMENICEKEFRDDREKIYDVATHWQPLPKPYKPKKDISAVGEHIMSRFMKAE